MEKQIQIMLDLQEAMNTKVDPNWREANNEWYRAIWVECAEMMDHVGYKWWKKQETNITQVQLEIVDIMHFMLAIGLLSPHYNAKWFAYSLKQKQLVNTIQNDIDKLAFEQLRAQNLMPCISLLKPIMDHVNMDFNELFKQYCAKNVLNIFRQDNGYKKGTYHKEWITDDGLLEDNEVLVNILYAYDGTEINFMGQIKDDLTLVYKESL